MHGGGTGTRRLDDAPLGPTVQGPERHSGVAEAHLSAAVTGHEDVVHAGMELHAGEFDGLL